MSSTVRSREIHRPAAIDDTVSSATSTSTAS